MSEHKFKVGDRVRVVIDQSFKEPISDFQFADNYQYGVVVEIGSTDDSVKLISRYDYTVKVVLDRDVDTHFTPAYYFRVEDLILDEEKENAKTKTYTKAGVGDILTCKKNNGKHLILAVLPNDIYLLSECNQFDVAGNWATDAELKEYMSWVSPREDKKRITIKELLKHYSDANGIEMSDIVVTEK